jgi:hypothetical protein
LNYESTPTVKRLYKDRTTEMYEASHQTEALHQADCTRRTEHPHRKTLPADTTAKCLIPEEDIEETVAMGEAEAEAQRQLQLHHQSLQEPVQS